MESSGKMTNEVLPFFYRGNISASKSLMNRALLVQSFFPDLTLEGSSECDDVIHMKKALTDLSSGKSEIFCGEAGTVFRFMAMRASRNTGEFYLTGNKRLIERPHQDVISLLNQLGVEAALDSQGLRIKSHGWKNPHKKIIVPREKSSQFATGFLLSTWLATFDLEFELSPKGLKDSYWEMSLQLVKDLGMEIEQEGQDHFRIKSHQKIKSNQYLVEPDMSSAFSVAAVAALAGDFHLMNMPKRSLQPDVKFIEILKQMGIFCQQEGSELTVSCTDEFIGANVNMRETPDLFPVLSVLCAFAKGKSHLYGAPRLVNKESNRIAKTSELLGLMGVENEPQNDGIIVHGKGREIAPKAFSFDPDHDHRMAMAAGVLKRLGWPVEIKTPEVVKKSFPEYWKVLELEA